MSGVMAVNADDPEQFIGFACGDANTVHFVFVKEIFRGLGIGRLLYDAIGRPTQYSHYTKNAKHLTRGMEFNPYTFYKGSNHVQGNQAYADLSG